MNCQAIQMRLLELERPDQPTAELTGHLAECSACRTWLQQLLLLEDHVPRLSVPPSQGKARFLAQFLAEKPAPRRLVAPPRSAHNGPTCSQPRVEPLWVRRERQLKRLALTLALTAALVLVAVGLWVWRFADEPASKPRPAPAEDVLLANLMKRNLKLASDKTPRQRLETLTDLADDLQSETRLLIEAANTNDLTALAQLYGKVVREGIVVQAQALPAAERATLLNPIAEQLTRTGNEAAQLADQLPVPASRPLRDIATAAREGDRQLRDLLRREKS